MTKNKNSFIKGSDEKNIEEATLQETLLPQVGRCLVVKSQVHFNWLSFSKRFLILFNSELRVASNYIQLVTRLIEQRSNMLKSSTWNCKL